MFGQGNMNMIFTAPTMQILKINILLSPIFGMQTYTLGTSSSMDDLIACFPRPAALQAFSSQFISNFQQ